MSQLFKKLSGKRRSLLLAVFAVTIIASFGVAYTFAGKSNNKDVVSNVCQGTCVALKETGAEPNAITVQRGEYVQFNSADGKSHSLSMGAGGEEHSHGGKFSSGEFKADEAWRVQFNDEGSFKFHDHFNPDINVVVVVYIEGKDYRITR